MPTEERILQAKFATLFKKEFPKSFYYKIPDTGGTGGRRPFDAFAVVNGYPIAIEFKSYKGVVTPLQKYNLTKFYKAGGQTIVIRQYGVPISIVKIKEGTRR